MMNVTKNTESMEIDWDAMFVNDAKYLLFVTELNNMKEPISINVDELLGPPDDEEIDEEIGDDIIEEEAVDDEIEDDIEDDDGIEDVDEIEYLDDDEDDEWDDVEYWDDDDWEDDEFIDDDYDEY